MSVCEGVGGHLHFATSAIASRGVCAADSVCGKRLAIEEQFPIETCFVFCARVCTPCLSVWSGWFTVKLFLFLWGETFVALLLVLLSTRNSLIPFSFSLSSPNYNKASKSQPKQTVKVTDDPRAY